MPNIRILNWNIEKLSQAKMAIPGMAAAIGRVIFDSNADIVILLEVQAGTWLFSMAAVSAAANALAAAAGAAHANDYTGWLVSHITGGEVYGVLIKNLNVVRPVEMIAGTAGGAAGDDNSPLTNMDRNRFRTWPGTFAAIPNAYAGAGLPIPVLRPRLPLTNVYSSPPRGRQPRQFAGRISARGGYALGRGFRMPCLAMFEIPAAAGASTVVPVLLCHLGAVRGGRNFLAQGQVRQYKETHVAQKFMNPVPLLLPKGGYIDLNNTATPVEELIISGDFNLDFLQQTPPLPGNSRRTTNRNAFNAMTPTTVNGGSAVPGALPGAPAPHTAIPPHAPLPPPAIPFGVLISPPGPDYNTIPNMTLKAAATTQGTILITYTPGVVPAAVAALRGACFDGFFFGGNRLSATFQTLTPAPPAADACAVIDLPAQMVQAGGGGAGALDVSAIQAHYQGLLAATAAAGAATMPPHFHYAYAAPNLAPGAAAAVLTTNDRLIGARFISDHLPTVVQFNLP